MQNDAPPTTPPSRDARAYFEEGATHNHTEERTLALERALYEQPVRLEWLRAQAMEPGGYLSRALRRRIWPKLLGVDRYQCEDEWRQRVELPSPRGRHVRRSGRATPRLLEDEQHVSRPSLACEDSVSEYSKVDRK